MSSELDQDMVELLAIIYRAVDWRKMRTRHRWADIFNHRIRAAARARDVDAFTSKLCNFFGLQSLPMDALPLLDALRPRSDAVLWDVYEKHIPYALHAQKRAKEKSDGTND